MQPSNILFWFGVLAISFGLFAGCLKRPITATNSNEPKQFSTLIIGGKTYRIEVAKTQNQQILGLSGRDEIGSDGLLFIFPNESRQTFWMKDMKFDLDFIWIRDGKVSEINFNVKKPEEGTNASDLSRYRPEEPADMMLEVVAGFAEKESVQVGDSVELK